MQTKQPSKPKQDSYREERQRVIDEVREVVEGMKKNINIEIPDTLHKNTGYNKALDDLLQGLNKLK